MDKSNVILLITVAASALQIILFFKIWIMTNDVSQLKDKILFGSRFMAKKYLLLGDKEKAKQLLLDSFFENIEEEGYSNFDKFKKQLENDFNKLGEELPEEIKNLKSMSDFEAIF